tara:strand:+ start:282 stop:428 length:147 start_codon:yes stop_codon:yes gene_type:complete
MITGMVIGGLTAVTAKQMLENRSCKLKSLKKSSDADEKMKDADEYAKD